MPVPDQEDVRVRPLGEDPARRGDEVEGRLLLHQPGDGPDDRRVGGNAERGAARVSPPVGHGLLRDPAH
ncbi:MAG: hypothetical protein ACM3ZF_04645, partial [Mycobacterium leprae]